MAADDAGGSARAWVEPRGASGFKPLKFLLIYSAVTLLFFSVSSSKLAPYILPMMPTLAAVIGVSCPRVPLSCGHWRG